MDSLLWFAKIGNYSDTSKEKAEKMAGTEGFMDNSETRHSPVPVVLSETRHSPVPVVL